MIEWYNIYNKATFQADNIVSRSVTKILGDLGEKDILITEGNCIGLTVDDVFLCVGLNDKNPFRMGDYLAYLDEDDEIWLGVWLED